MRNCNTICKRSYLCEKEFSFHFTTSEYFYNLILLRSVSPLVVPPASGNEPMYWSSFMTSSMQLAKECLSQKLTDDMGESFQPFEGLEKFAETIETGMLMMYDSIKQD